MRPEWPRLDAVRGRAGLIVAAVVVLVTLGLSVLVQRGGHGWVRTALGWNLLGIDSPMYPAFADLRSVTGRWECVRSGVDVYRRVSCDPWGRAFNYPPVWLLPAYLGLGASATVPIGLGEAVLLLAALSALFPQRTLRTQITTVLVALSTPVLFAVERGNVDLLIFVAIVATFHATRDLTPARRGAARFAALTALTWLKLFPIAGLAHLARSPRRAAATGAGVALLVAALALVYARVAPRIAANTVHELAHNYGRLALFVHRSDASDRAGPAGRDSLAAAIAAACAAATFGAAHARRWLDRLPNLLEGRHETDLAAVGLAVYMLTFLIGLNFDYRLIFLVLVFPSLIRRDAERWNTAAARVQALLLARLLLAHRLPDRSSAVIDWILFSGSAAWAGASARCAWTLDRSPREALHSPRSPSATRRMQLARMVRGLVA